MNEYTKDWDKPPKHTHSPRTHLKWTPWLLILIATASQASALSDRPDCLVTLTAYDTPIPYSDRQLVPMVIVQTKGRHCPTPEITEGNLLELDTPGAWQAGIGMRIQARVQRYSSMGTEGPVTGLHWSDFRDAQGKRLPNTHPLNNGIVKRYPE